jgi:hypothetical protein
MVIAGNSKAGRHRGPNIDRMSILTEATASGRMRAFLAAGRASEFQKSDTVLHRPLARIARCTLSIVRLSDRAIGS